MNELPLECVLCLLVLNGYAYAFERSAAAISDPYCKAALCRQFFLFCCTLRFVSVFFNSVYLIAIVLPFVATSVKVYDQDFVKMFMSVLDAAYNQLVQFPSMIRYSGSLDQVFALT